MNNLKIYSVSDRYIDFLRERNPNIYSNKEGHRTHTRKYIGVVLQMKEFCYYIPLSSPKQSDYQVAGKNLVIKKSIVPIIRIVVKNSRGIKELKGTLRISHMIPVPESELELYDVDGEKDETYKDLVQNEVIFIRRNKEKIEKNANLLYRQKQKNDTEIGYVKSALDYKRLERFCEEFCVKKDQIHQNNAYDPENDGN